MVAVIGAGVVGCACSLYLQRSGYQVTLFDQNEPGLGASFGNAGIFADYARLPFASFSNLLAVPGLLLAKDSPLSIRPSHFRKMIPYGYWFAKATLPSNYQQGGDTLTWLSGLAAEADPILWNFASAQDLIGGEGCIALYGNQSDKQNSIPSHIIERKARGVALKVLSKAELHDLEPGLNAFYRGGVLYEKTRFARDPHKLTQRYFSAFLQAGGSFQRSEARPKIRADGEVEICLTEKKLRFDRIVVAAGVQSTNLIGALGSAVPLVSERGYHLVLSGDKSQLKRPVVWLDKSVFLTPMAEGIRVAGTAEFADPGDRPDSSRVLQMLSVAHEMLANPGKKLRDWVGSRPSTPDSLPVIGQSRASNRIIFAFGHGHLGLSLSGATALLIKNILDDKEDKARLQKLSPMRFV